ncbi:MAG: hypothetical protein RDV48_27810 [Candidatus Eremiobacteraeota bacterium]|nr:hypothetical protein [Candidatus Eremiobacteraeota bacterium]
MPIGTHQIFVGPALSCANTADERYGKRVPYNLSEYIHEQRVALSTPYFFQEWQPERRWVEFHDGAFYPKENSWTQIITSDHPDAQRTRHELLHQPHNLGIHSPNIMIDVLDDSYGHFKKNQSLESICRAMEYAQTVGADYFVYHLVQRDLWVDPSMRRNMLIPESLRVYAWLSEYYRRRKFTFVPCIEVLEYPKYPATPFEVRQILKSCQLILPQTRLAFDISHLWRSRSLICETQRSGFENVRFKVFYHVLKDALDPLGPDDIYVFHLGGCWGIRTHEVPGILPDDDPFDSLYRLDCPDYLYDEYFEMNVSRALDAVVDFCFVHSVPIRLILEIFNKEYPVVLRALEEVSAALHAKVLRRWRS